MLLNTSVFFEPICRRMFTLRAIKYFFLAFLTFSVLSSCEESTTSGAGNAGTQDSIITNETPEKPVKEAEWLCIPNKQVGKIEANSDEESIIAAYSKENVIRQEVGIGEGEMVAASIVFPGTPNELIVEWQEGFEYQKVFRIRIEQEGAKWETQEGIKIGTTLEELVKINGKDFNFYGFEWDYGGVTNEWEGGNINSQLTVVLSPRNEEAVFPELSGDGLFSSSNPKAKEARLEVSAIVIYFGL